MAGQSGLQPVFRRAIADVGLFSLLINLLLLVIPLYLLQVYDRVLPSSSVETLVYLSAMAVAALGFLEAPVVAGALIAVIGGSTAMFTPMVWTMLQELTPAHLLGRVFTSFATGGMASSMAGMAGFGWAADTIGPAASLGGISLILLMTAATAWLFSFYKSHTGSLAISTSSPLAS